MPQDIISHIDCFSLIFPKDDPRSADAYTRMMRPVFDFEIPKSARKTRFSCAVDVYRLPDVTVSQTTGSASRFTRTLKTIARSAIDQVFVVCYRSGHFAFETGDIKRRVAADAFVFFDLASEVAIEAPTVDNISLAVSRRRLEALFPVLDHSHGTVITPSPLTRILLGMMENIIAIGPAMTVTEARPIADAIIQLVAAALEAPLRQQAMTAGGNGAVSQIAIKAEIERSLTDPALGPQALLDRFGITRSTLYRLFEPSGGVAAYIAKRRLRLAFRRITDPAESGLRVSQLAFDLGFSHASAFTRAFGEFFGMSPKDAKALAVQPEEHELEFLLSPEGRPYIHPVRSPAAPVGRA